MGSFIPFICKGFFQDHPNGGWFFGIGIAEPSTVGLGFAVDEPKEWGRGKTSLQGTNIFHIFPLKVDEKMISIDVPPRSTYPSDFWSV